MNNIKNVYGMRESGGMFAVLFSNLPKLSYSFALWQSTPDDITLTCIIF